MYSLAASRLDLIKCSVHVLAWADMWCRPEHKASLVWHQFELNWRLYSQKQAATTSVALNPSHIDHPFVVVFE